MYTYLVVNGKALARVRWINTCIWDDREGVGSLINYPMNFDLDALARGLYTARTGLPRAVALLMQGKLVELPAAIEVSSSFGIEFSAQQKALNARYNTFKFDK